MFLTITVLSGFEKYWAFKQIYLKNTKH